MRFCTDWPVAFDFVGEYALEDGEVNEGSVAPEKECKPGISPQCFFWFQ